MASEDGGLPKEAQYRDFGYRPSELTHHYGPNVHILSDPLLLTQLAKFCSESTAQPLLNDLIGMIYRGLLAHAIGQEFPTEYVSWPTRMKAQHAEGVYEGPVLSQKTRAISVNLARAGTLPSHVCYSALNYVLPPDQVRQDHLSIARVSDTSHQVTGSVLSGHKIGGPVDGSIVLFPDPMAATGSTLIEALDLYKTYGKARKWIALHCIVTPEYLRNVLRAHPDLIIYTVRLDRGLSPADVLKKPLGEDWGREKGLNDHQYIVPGGGGIGEVLNNAFV